MCITCVARVYFDNNHTYRYNIYGFANRTLNAVLTSWSFVGVLMSVAVAFFLISC